MSVSAHVWFSELEKSKGLIEALKSHDFNRLLNILGCDGGSLDSAS